MKIIIIPIPVNDVEEKIIWKLTSDGTFSVKATTWTNNVSILPHPRVKPHLET